MSLSLTKQPRRRPSPSRRDQELYVRYQTTGITQAELAGDCGLTQCRVSQIIRRVEKWRAEINPQPHDLTPAGGQTPLEQRRLDRWLERERNEVLFKQSLRQAQQPQVVKTTKTGPDGQEVTIRELPVSPQWLRLAQRANEQLFRREALAPLPQERPDDELRQQIMQQELVELCIQALGRRLFSHATHPYTLVEQLLQLLRGQPLTAEDGIDRGFGELAQLLAQTAAGEAAAAEPTAGGQDAAPSADAQAENASGGDPAADTISSTCAELDDSPQTESGEELECHDQDADCDSQPPKRLGPKLRKFFEQAVNDPDTPDEARQSIRRRLRADSHSTPKTARCLTSWDSTQDEPRGTSRGA
jgi:hypothetical protein